MERRTSVNAGIALGHVGRAIVGLAFLIAGTTKALHPAAFMRDIESYRLIPEATVYWVAAFLPYLELVTGVALLLSRQRRGARFIAGALLLIFIAALASAWARGLDIACGCFGGGSGEPANYPWLVLRDLLLLACLAQDLIASRWQAHSAKSV